MSSIFIPHKSHVPTFSTDKPRASETAVPGFIASTSFVANMVDFIVILII